MFSLLTLTAAVGCVALGLKGILTCSLPLTKHRTLRGAKCAVVGVLLLAASGVFWYLFAVGLQWDR